VPDLCRLLRDAILDEVGAQTQYQRLRASLEAEARTPGEQALAAHLLDAVQADEQRHSALFRSLYDVYCRQEGDGRG